MDWSPEEVRAAVQAYFEMLRREAAGIPFTKADFNREVRKVCKDRTKASVELKFQNVSAVLEENRLPRIEGYAPRHNYQNLLAEQVVDYLQTAPFLEPPEQPKVAPDAPRPTDWRAIIVPRPALKSPPPPKVRLPPQLFCKVDYAARDAANRSLGLAGERFVLELEKDRLRTFGHEDLARKVVHASQEEGDGLGFDIRSFNDAGGPRLIEVKTTRLGPRAPFFMSPGEVDFARTCEDDYQLARLFHWGRHPGVFLLGADDVSLLRMEPQQFRCWV